MKVLAVDDTPTNLEIMQVLLRSAGHEVLGVGDGEAALAAVATFGPDIVFMDLALPGAIDGLETTRRIKGLPAARDVAVVAVTAMVGRNDMRNAAEAGCDGFIRKPYTRRELLDAIARCCPACPAT